MNKKSIAIITARGGSKRIPRKNIKDFCGKPIIAYSIEAAIQSGCFDTVMVSTDDEEIAGISRTYGAQVPFMRSSETASDFATTADVLLEVIREYQKNGINYDYLCCIYPTAPFITPERLQEAMQIMEETQPAEIIPVIPLSDPPQRCFIIGEDGNMEYKYREFVNARSQDLEKQYHDAGQFYLYRTDRLLEVQDTISEGLMPLILDEMEVQDIDTREDWEIAEMKYNILKGQGKLQ